MFNIMLKHNISCMPKFTGTRGGFTTAYGTMRYIRAVCFLFKTKKISEMHGHKRATQSSIVISK